MVAPAPLDRVLRLGDWWVDVHRGRLTQPGTAGPEVRLEPKALQVLLCLARRRGEVVAKEEIFREVWGDAFVGDQVLTNAIWELRRALGDDARGQRLIQTVPRRGYRLAEEAPGEAIAGPAAVPDAAPPADLGRRPPARRARRALAIALAAAAVLAILAWAASRLPGRPTRGVTRFSVEFREPLAALYLPVAALSPDATRLVFVSESAGTTRLHLRTMDALEATPVPGTEGAHAPFFSPDGGAVGFYAAGELQTVALNGVGSPHPIQSIYTPRGAAWGDDGWIYFTPGSAGEIWRVPATGGDAEQVSTLAGSEWSHRWPEVLPGAGAILFTVADDALVTGFDEARIFVQSLSTGTRRLLVDGGSYPRYAAGRLVFARDASLYAAPFDPERLVLTGTAVEVLAGVRRFPINGAAQFALARDGSLAYVPGRLEWEPPRSLLRVARDGRERPLSEREQLYYDPALSPEGRRLAVVIADRGNSDLWVLDLERGARSRLTDTPGEEQGPLWTPDGTRIAYYYSLHGPFQMYWKRADGGGDAERLAVSEHSQRPEAFTPDGRVLVYSEQRPETGFDLWALTLDGSAPPRPLLATRFHELHARLSPDGRWLAYASDESGGPQVYLRPFDGSGGALPLSAGGGSEPRWHPSGRSVLYHTDDAVLEVPLDLGAPPAAGAPRRLFAWRFPPRVFEGEHRREFDLFPDGDLLLLATPAPEPRRLHVVLGWYQELFRSRSRGASRR